MRVKNMIDRKLEIFRMAATLRNFTEAAAALGMSQPNVTHQLARLEESLGVKLFLRDGRRVVLTAAGRMLADRCEELFADSEKIIRAVQSCAVGVRHFNIGGTLTAGGYVLPALIAAFMRENEHYSLDLKVANTRRIEDALTARKLDVAMVEGPFEPNYFLSEPYFEDELVPVFSPGACPPEFSLARYIESGRRLILRETGSGTRYYFDRFLQAQGMPPPDLSSIQEVNSFDALKLFVRQGFGITVISRLAIRDELAAGLLQCGRFAEGPILRKLNFIYLPDQNLKFAEKFIAFCRKQVPE